MRLLLFMLIGTIWLGCSPAEKNTPNSQIEAGTFDWLLGNWRRTNHEVGKQTFEQWVKKSETEYHGLGFTMQNTDTVWQEAILLIQREGQWQFEVRGEDAPQGTVFKVVKFDSLSFRSENPDNEFPTAIEYALVHDMINAVISGGETEIPFDFERQSAK